jgi:hypothetical protein
MIVPSGMAGEFGRARERALHHLGEFGGQVAALGRVGFHLDLVEEGGGPSRLGGPALIEPGTPWPQFEGVPLTLLAVLDLAEFAPLLGDELPDSAGDLVLNFFHCSPNAHLYGSGWGLVFDPRGWRVVPARRETAVEVAAPDPAVRFQPVTLRAVPVATFPEIEEPVVDELICGPGSDRFDHESWSGLAARYRAWFQECGGGLDRGHQAFGWPWVLHGSPAEEGRRQLVERDPAAGAAAPPAGQWRLLLQLDSDGRILTEDGKRWWQWADSGELHYVIPAAALRAGDFSRAEAAVQG